MNFQDVFQEYFPQFRGQAVNIPSTFEDREWKQAIILCNASIKKWDRADGTLWNELVARAQDQSLTIFPLVAKTITSGTVSYAAPTNMRKPPKEVWAFNGTNYRKIQVVDAKDLSGLSELSSAVTFLGSANAGYTMLISQKTSDDYNGWQVDYLYYRKPNTLPFSQLAADVVLDMSDPTFAIQDMLAGRFTNARNGFGYKVASAEAKSALLNMKIENSSGVPGRSDNLLTMQPPEWGINTVNSSDMEL